ncbi:MAG: hypothetical protein IJ529_01025 [Alphaproteobacteria bacterium]|nr:hypothetical protein [Alphaproteobacteria bacterium]MBQ9234875.1 hypothetical protein [Alphaproteobacteria bacterium]
MKKRLLLFVLVLSGCVQNRFLYTDEKGSNVYQTDCSWSDFGDCLIEANKSCPMGFNIVMSSENPTGSFSNFDGHGTTTGFGNFYSSNYNGWGNSWNTYSRYIIYSCKLEK